MRKQLAFLCFAALIYTLPAFSQDMKTRDTIAMTGTAMSGMRFYLHGENLSRRKTKALLKLNPEAYTLFKKAKTNTVFSLIFSALGGFAIGWEVGTALGGKTVNWAIIGSGFGAYGISVPFALGANRNARKAIDLYNQLH